MAGRGHFKIDDLLSELDRKAYAQHLAGNPTVDQCVEWLMQRGYMIGRSSVHRHRQEFSRKLSQMHRSYNEAKAVIELQQDGSGIELEDATLKIMTHRVLNGLVLAGDDDEPIAAKDIPAYAHAVARLMSAATSGGRLKLAREKALREAEAKINAAVEARLKAHPEALVIVQGAIAETVAELREGAQ